jgi:hypothetical protein
MNNTFGIDVNDAIAAMGGEPTAVEYKFYDDTVSVFYDDKEHSYIRYDETGQVNIPGVTTAVHIIDKPALQPWAAKMTVGYIKEKFDITKLYTEEEFDGLLTSAKRNYKDYVQAAADTGKLAHDAIEQYIKQQLGLPNKGLYMPEDPRAANGVKAALEWLDKHKVRFVCTERKIYSKEHDFAGTLDAIGHVTSCDDIDCCGQWVEHEGTALRVPVVFQDVLATIDWKTSNGLWPEYAYQTAAYTLAQNEEHGLKIEHRFINRLDKDDASFESWYLGPSRLALDTRIFLDCLYLYRDIKLRESMDKVENKISRLAKSAAKELAKQAKAEAKLAEKADKKAAKELEKKMKEQAKLIAKQISRRAA